MALLPARLRARLRRTLPTSTMGSTQTPGMLSVLLPTAPLDCSRHATFVVMVQATQLSNLNNGSIAWRLRSSRLGSVFGQR